MNPGADLSEAVTVVERTWKAIYPEGIFNGIFLDEELTATYYPFYCRVC